MLPFQAQRNSSHLLNTYNVDCKYANVNKKLVIINSEIPNNGLEKPWTEEIVR